jgi:hypothetical protein
LRKFEIELYSLMRRVLEFGLTADDMVAKSTAALFVRDEGAI